MQTPSPRDQRRVVRAVTAPRSPDMDFGIATACTYMPPDKQAQRSVKAPPLLLLLLLLQLNVDENHTCCSPRERGENGSGSKRCSNVDCGRIVSGQDVHAKPLFCQ